MSFLSYKELIEEGDTVILYLSANSMHALRVVRTILNKNNESVENVFQTTYGALKVANLVGKSFGSKVELTRGWAYVLHPTPELWTLTLPHRTQINYGTDISMIVFQLEIGPGSLVVEAGTGSGSLTHALARSVRPGGTVCTFDFHEQRVAVAKEEFDSHGLASVVEARHRDVCEHGFGQELDGRADAIFLDLPHPWLVIKHALKAYKQSALYNSELYCDHPKSLRMKIASKRSNMFYKNKKQERTEVGGRFCSFSPCIEQVQRTCEALRSCGFTEVTTLECLQREIIVCPRSQSSLNFDKAESSADDSKYSFVSSSYAQTMPGHTGYLTFATLPPTWARIASPQPPTPTQSETQEEDPKKNDNN